MTEHQCICENEDRLLGLVISNLDEVWPHHSLYPDSGEWHTNIDLGVITVRVSQAGTWTSLDKVADFLVGEIGDLAWTEIRAAWLNPFQSVEEQMPSLLHATTLMDFLPMMKSQLTDILVHRRLKTFFQPIFHTASLEVWGYECLIRGYDENQQLISPGQLLEWSRKESLLFRFDRLCREIHIQSAAEKITNPDHHITINFLPTAIYQPRFCLSTTFRAIQKTEMKHERILFEVVETEKVENVAVLKEILNAYRERGFLVGLDDIGMGHSGLMMIAELAPDLLKLDRQLVVGATKSDAHRVVCETLVNMGKAMNKLVLAEGVETDEQADLMRELGVDLLQGYLLGRPEKEPALSSDFHWSESTAK